MVLEMGLWKNHYSQEIKDYYCESYLIKKINLVVKKLRKENYENFYVHWFVEEKDRIRIMSIDGKAIVLKYFYTFKTPFHHDKDEFLPLKSLLQSSWRNAIVKYISNTVLILQSTEEFDIIDEAGNIIHKKVRKYQTKNFQRYFYEEVE